LDHEQKRSDASWAERLSSASIPDWDLPLIAQDGDAAVGMVWGRIDPSSPRIAQVNQMWVAPEARGRGVGSILLNSVIEWAGEAGAEQVVLRVTCGDSPAKRLYAGSGFAVAGDPGPLRDGSPILAQPMSLEL
jgi:GNAT superfamily N-acetyltransferase